MVPMSQSRNTGSMPANLFISWPGQKCVRRNNPAVRLPTTHAPILRRESWANPHRYTTSRHPNSDKQIVSSGALPPPRLAWDGSASDVEGVAVAHGRSLDVLLCILIKRTPALWPCLRRQITCWMIGWCEYMECSRGAQTCLSSSCAPRLRRRTPSSRRTASRQTATGHRQF